MDETEAPYYDSMYEMDAPGLVDFDATDISVNESIFDRKVVGERCTRVFKDIGNVTPKWCKSATHSMASKAEISVSSPLTKKTPQNKTPVAEAVSRRITRSVTKEMNKLEITLSPTQPMLAASPTLKSEAAHASPPKELTLQPTAVKLEESAVCRDVLQPYPQPVQYNTLDTRGSPMPTNPCGKRMSAKVSNASNATNGKVGLTEKKSETDRSLRSRTSSDGRRPQPAHSGTPFKGKRSPLKTLRARTRSKDNADSRHGLHLRTSSATSTTSSSSAPSHNLRQRTSQPLRRSLSQSGSSSLSTVSSSTGVSQTLSRLMRPTEAAKSKIHPSVPRPSPSKRKSSSASKSKPPKLQKNTIPKSPTFLRRSRTRLTPMKSTEDLVMEKVEQEKNELRSLRKINEAGLKSMNLSGGKIGKQSGVPKSDGAGKVKRSIYDQMGRATSSEPASQYPQTQESCTGSTTRSRDVSNQKVNITKARSPKFQTKLRERAPSALSAAEREQMELDKMKEAQFKATPLDRRVLDGSTGVNLVHRLPLTEPVSMTFATDKRKAAHAAKEKEVEPVQRIIKANPPPKQTAVFQPKLEHKRTQAQPFTFESKDEEAKRRRAELLRKAEEHERKIKEFKANPLPPSPTPVPAKQILPTTVPEPFHLKIDERGEQQQEKFKRKVEAETARMREAAIRHASTADVLKKVPFVPKKEAPKFTEPLNVELSSAKRAEERKEYQLRKNESEAKSRILEEELRQKQAAEEKREVMRLRQETIIKPAPIKRYKPVQIRQSARPLTQPKSPRFSQR